MTWSWPQTVRGRWLISAGVAVIAVVAIGNLVRILSKADRTLLDASLSIAVAVVVVAALIATTVAALRSSRRQAQTRRLRLRHDVAFMSKVDPLKIGIARASRPVRPADYLRRTPRDDELDRIIRAALAPGADHWLVVVDGRAAVGKSRTLYQALRRYETDRRPLTLVAPEDTDALRNLFDPDRGLPKIVGPAVLWLDDIENFFNTGMTAGDLRKWRSGGARRMVAATFGSRSLVAGRQVLGYFRDTYTPLTLEKTTKAELEQGTVKLGQAEFDAACEVGLAAYLIGGDLLADKLDSGKHPGESTLCAEGLAVVRAAIDWVRSGRSDPVPSDTLRQLWPEYLPATVAADDAGFKRGLAWAVAPLVDESLARKGRGRRRTALLSESADGYRADPYAVYLRSEDDLNGPADRVWQLALAAAPPLQAMAVGSKASARGRWDDAINGLSIAATAPPAELPGNLGAQARVAVANFHMLRGSGTEALEAWRKVIEVVGDDPDPSQRLLIVNAWISTIALLARTGDPALQQEARDAGQHLIDEYFSTKDTFIRQAIRAHAATALVNKGTLAANQGQVEEAVAAWDLLIDDCFDGRDPSAASEDGKPDLDHPDPYLPVNLCKALFYKGNLLAGFDAASVGGAPDTGQALDAYGRLLKAFALTSRPTTSQQVEIQEMRQKTVVHQALIAIRVGDKSDQAREAVQNARQVCEGRVAACDAVRATVAPYSRTGLDLAITEELLTKAQLHSYLGEVAAGGACYQRIFADYGGSQQPQMRILLARALYGDGRRYVAISKNLGHSGDIAAHRFNTLIAEFGHESNPLMKALVAQARAELAGLGQ